MCLFFSVHLTAHASLQARPGAVDDKYRSGESVNEQQAPYIVRLFFLFLHLFPFVKVEQV